MLYRPFTVTNRLLLALSPANLAQLLPKLRTVTLPVRTLITSANHSVTSVNFMESGWASVVAYLDEGTQAEIGLIGREGMTGLPLVLGVDTAFAETYMQANGTALQISADAFKREMADNRELRNLLLRYTEAVHSQTGQASACNGGHGLEQRLARWLLMAHDKGDSDVLPLTQEFLAMMLCVYRPSVTVIARSLQAAGLISYTKGQITILDRRGLESTACGCYQIVKNRFDDLLGQKSNTVRYETVARWPLG